MHGKDFKLLVPLLFLSLWLPDNCAKDSALFPIVLILLTQRDNDDDDGGAFLREKDEK